MPLYPSKSERTVPVSAEVYETDKARFEEEAARHGVSVRKLNAHVVRWWLARVASTQLK